ncbi:NAD(P)/FAD-dependent oxidoreductase [Desulfopila sp. IMCC35008]|uniref:NAD(P)/FAD-dependent oxidoreductase n=1 Tax=Desulfopila sp. IMCC35008 TaxID=2653858 RepID=UPI0013D74893|nr:FAD-dependent oxidoreductase [Desulfopila sp. IMCC35008]
MGQHLVLAGAGHAHMVTLQNISVLIGKGHRVTAIGPSEHHFYSGMGPGMLGGTYASDEISFNSKKGVEGQGGTFVKDLVVRIDCEKKTVTLQSGTEIGYDVLSCNCGSQVVSSFGYGEIPVYPVKPIENLKNLRQAIKQKKTGEPVCVAVIGGGPSSAEVAGNLIQLFVQDGRPGSKVHLLCRSHFMSGFNEKVRKYCRGYLAKQDVIIAENTGNASLVGREVVLTDGNRIEVDFVVQATGVRPVSLFSDSSMTTGPDGGLAVNEYLQYVNDPSIFGGGDCISFMPQPLSKVGVYAVRQNQVLYSNLVAALDGKGLQTFDPGGEFLLVFNLGCGYGVLQKMGFVFRGKLPFWIKDLIDRRFMKRFQG